jgi:HEAT repeat protein
MAPIEAVGGAQDVISQETTRDEDAAAPAPAAKADTRESAVPRGTPAEPGTLAGLEAYEEDMAREGTTSSESEEGKRVAVLVKALREDSSAEVRRVAAWGLENYAEYKPASDALAAALNTDADESVREMAAWALAESNGGETVAAALNTAFRNTKQPAVRLTAAWAAGEIGDPALVPGLITLLANTDPQLREVAAWSIGSCGTEKAPAPLVALLKDTDRSVRLSAAWALGEIGDAACAGEIEAAFKRETDPEVQRGLIWALGSMGDGSIETLTRLVSSPDPQIRAAAVSSLAGRSNSPWPWPRPEPRPHP